MKMESVLMILLLIQNLFTDLLILTLIIAFAGKKRKKTGRERASGPAPEPYFFQVPASDPEETDAGTPILREFEISPDEDHSHFAEKPSPSAGTAPAEPPDGVTVNKLYPIAGLRAVSFSAHHPVEFEEIPVRDAEFLLYPDMGVRPADRVYGVYNSRTYFTEKGFSRIYKFLNAREQIVEIAECRKMKCLKLVKAANVTRDSYGSKYRLRSEGILMAEVER